MGAGTILLIVLILVLIGVLPRWPRTKNWGYGPSGIVCVGAGHSHRPILDGTRVTARHEFHPRSTSHHQGFAPLLARFVHYRTERSRPGPYADQVNGTGRRPLGGAAVCPASGCERN